MAKQQKAWMPKPAKTSKTAIPDAIKLDLESKAANLIENVLKPKHVVPQKPDIEFNYISDIGTKWYRKYFYFFSTYTCPGPNAISPSFESEFARMEYLGAADDFDDALTNWLEWKYGFAGIGSHCWE